MMKKRMSVIQIIVSSLRILINLHEAQSYCGYYQGVLTCSGLTETTFEEARSSYANRTMYTITISNSDISTLKSGMFDAGPGAWRQIMIIEMTACGITYIEDNAFAYNAGSNMVPLPELSYINLSANKMKLLSNTAFRGLQLAHLDMSFNALTLIMTQTSDNLGYLKWLDVSFNQVNETRQSTFRGMTDLAYLNISNNPGIQLKLGTLQSVPNLKVLNISGNSVKSEYGLFTALRKLEVLDVTMNSISVDHLTPLINLRVLIYDSNRLSFDTELLGLTRRVPKLEQLSMYNVTEWTCPNLEEHIVRFQSEGILVGLDNPLVTTSLNVNGIPCT